MNKQLYLIITFQLFFTLAFAQVPTIKVTGASDSSVTLQSLKIDIKVAGNIATTSMEMTFHNSSQRILEGSLTFPLPQGVTVSGYALDINGKLREAVPVEKEKATQVFESIERRRVDPGLLEKVAGNNFRTRIYPLPADGNRIVKISYDEILQPSSATTLRYSLPLTYTNAIPNFNLSINVVQAAIAPVLEEQPGDIIFKEWYNNYSAAIDKKNFIPSGSLRFAIPKKNNFSETVIQKVGGEYYFMTNTFIDQPAPRKKANATTVGIVWDASISGLNRNIASEIELLEKYFELNKNCKVELATISNVFEKKAVYIIVNGDWSSLKKDLSTITYDGATNLSTINLNAIPCSEYFLFSDGMSTFGNAQFIQNNKPVYTITSSLQSNFGELQLIAKNSGGQFINLTSSNTSEALKSLTEEPFQFISIKKNNSITESYPSMPVAITNGSFSVTGIAASSIETIVLQFGYGNTVTVEKEIQLNYVKQQSAQVNLQKFWAQQKIAELDLQHEKNKDEISLLGKRFSIVTRNTSLMVLETVEDYVRYKIGPPAELKKEYYAILKERRNEEMEEELKAYDIYTSFKDLMEWWKPSASKQSNVKPHPPVSRVEEIRVNRATADGIASPTAPAQAMEVQASPASPNKSMEEEPAIQRKQMTASTIKIEELKDAHIGFTNQALQGKVAGVSITNNNLDEVIVTGYSARKRITEPSIIVADWTPDRPYLLAMDSVAAAEHYTKYLELRKDFISTPTFYFDMAGFFFRIKDKATAVKILSNIAELKIEDHELYVMLGFKLKEAGEYNNALFIFKKVLDWRPHEPQSYRHYALALADAGQWQLAADTLYAGITKKYPEDIIDNYEGIEDVMLMELNNLLIQHKNEINTARYNKKIIAAMPVDIRVVLNWNRNDTDIDLWVTDPKGEKCYYGNSSTTNGALLSEDMTEGYGPEQLMVKKALKGKYRIEIHYYGDDQVKLTGPSTVMAEIFTRYNTGKEVRKIITMQMENEESKDGIFVGEFSFD